MVENEHDPVFELVFSEEIAHEHDPVFELVFSEEIDHDDWREIRGKSFEEVALLFAIRYNSEYNLIDNCEEIVIKNPRTNKVKTFIISAEEGINYSINEK